MPRAVQREEYHAMASVPCAKRNESNGLHYAIAAFNVLQKENFNSSNHKKLQIIISFPFVSQLTRYIRRKKCFL
jgi:hypothetical protein